MKRNRWMWKRILSGLLASALCLSMAGPAMADTWAYKDHSKVGANQPLMLGHRIIDLKNWNPETDPWADLMRAEVPLQENIAPYAATQANPALKSEAEVMYMAGDYGNSFNQGTPYNNQFSENMFNFWQYVDYYCAWHGAAVAGTPLSIWDGYNELNDTTGNGWKTERNFEFGSINMPNPGYTNAAHRNGVLSMGCVYFDPNNRPGQPVHPLFERDEEGNFIIAEKLVEFANWYGFDGYFFNQEEAIDAADVPLYKEFIQQVREAGLYCQMYDSLNDNGGINAWTSTLDEDTYHLIEDPEVGKVNDSVFISYDWSAGNKMATSLKNMEAWNVDPYKQVFFGVEANQGKMLSGGHNSTYNFAEYMYKEGTKDLVGSVALFTADGFIHDQIEDVIKSDDPNDREKDEYQWMVFERERMYFSGANSDPTDTGEKPGASRTDLGLNDVGGWVGVADFKSENSVAGGDTFYTDFNTGHGMSYYVDGQVSNEEEWGNMNLQGILPTWQWWMTSEGDKLTVDFDYGPKYQEFDVNGQAMDLGYEQVGAYKGGSSLVVHGNLDSENLLRLYKTDLAVEESTTADIWYNKPSETDASMMKLALIFEGSDEVVYLPLEGTGAKTEGFVKVSADLSAYAGKEIAMLGLAFAPGEEAIADYQMNIGAIAVSNDLETAPAAPTGLKIEKAYDSAEMIVSWDLADYDQVREYNLYGVYEDGSRKMLGGTYGSKYYIKNVGDKAALTSIEIVAVGPNGAESAAAKADMDYNSSVSELKVKEAQTSTEFYYQTEKAGEVSAEWKAPAVQPDSYALEVTMDYSSNKTVYTATAAGDATSATVKVPVKEGRYTLTVYPVVNGEKGTGVSYGGYMKDVYSAPYDGKLEMINGGRTIFLDSPTSTDWWKISVKYNGEELTIPNKYSASNTKGVKGVARLNAISAPADEGVLEVVLTDYSGNVSEPAYVPFSKNGDVESVNKTLLQKTYDYALTQSTEGVVESAVKKFEDAKARAKELLDMRYPSQEQIDAAWNELVDAIHGLGLFQGDKTELKMLIDMADEMMENADKYVDTNWQQLVDALAAAKDVYNDGDAMEEDVQPAADALLEAILAQRFKADKSNLEDLINKAESIDLSKYTEESVAVFNAALKTANLVLADESLSEDDQDVVDNAVAELNAAIENLSVKDDSSDSDNSSKPDDGKDDTSKPDDGKGDPNDNKDDGKNESPATGDNMMACTAALVLLAVSGSLLVLRRKAKAE